MISKVTVTTIYECALERAFKTPMLCDVSKIHTGYGLMPKVTHCTDDENWGRPGSNKKIYTATSFTQKGGFTSVDKILERIENNYWKLQVDEFQSWMLSFYKFEGEWKTTQLGLNKIQIDYTYSLYSDSLLLYPLCWLFANTFWKAYMNRVLENIRQLAYANEPYLYK
jgi:hypothetical protein